jgi:DNA-binding response OmpR family regulator
VADSGPHAIELASAHQGSIDLMITDAAMSGASGHPIADAVRAAQDNIKMLYVTGHAGGMMLPSGFVETSGAYLHKPFTSDALARKVRATLSR